MSITKLDAIDSRLLRAFVAVTETGNFTAAARSIAMTQSGISQHVARLEEALGVELFVRSHAGAELTDAGKHFRTFVDAYSSSVTTLLQTLAHTDEALNGKVRYAMPESCLFADHFEKLLATRAIEFPDVKIAVQIEPMDRVYESVREGDVDFGFVAGQRQDPIFQHQFFCREEYVLVAPLKTLPSTLKAKDVAAMEFVDYPGFYENFSLWFQRQLPRSRIPQPHNLRMVGKVGSLFGVMTMVRSGVGATIVPRQCARPLFAAHDLDVCPKRERQENQHEIYIVTRAERPLSASINRVLQTFLHMK